MLKANWIGSAGICMILAAAFFSQGAEPEIRSQPAQLRVLSYNIHHGAGVDNKLDLPRIAEVIKSVKPDLVALQEVDRGVQRTERVDEPQQLASLTGMHVVFGNNIRYQGGDYGNAVLSRYPIKAYKNHPLPSHYEGEQRGVMEVEIAPTSFDQSIIFLATHLDYRPDDGERLDSVKFINELLASKKGQPALLAGDLNAPPDSTTLRGFKTVWTSVNDKVMPTFPVEKPTRQIDFILFHPAERWKPIEVRVLDEAVASDHRAIFAVLEMLPDGSDKAGP